MGKRHVLQRWLLTTGIRLQSIAGIYVNIGMAMSSHMVWNEKQ